MKIRYYGHSCFRLVTENGTSVVTDPYRNVGYELPIGIAADVVTVSHGHYDHDYTDGVAAKAILKEVATYIYDDVRFETIDTYHDGEHGRLRGKNSLFKIYADGFTLCHLGDLGEPPSRALLEKIGRADVLFVPIGGTYTIDAEQARSYMAAIAPKITIPMHFRPQDGTLDIETAQPFLDLFDKQNVLFCGEELECTKETLEKYCGKIIVMERSK